MTNNIYTYDSNICREEAIKRNTEILKCNKCGVIGKGPNMFRWHFDNCKTHFKKCQQCGEIIPRQGIKDFQYNKKIFCNRSCYIESKKGKIPLIMTDEIKNKISISSIKYSKQRSESAKNRKIWIKSNRGKGKKRDRKNLN